MPQPGTWVTALFSQLFKGKFYFCEGADTRNISTKAECRAAHYRWVRRKYNFDNLGQVGRAVMGGRQVVVMVGLLDQVVTSVLPVMSVHPTGIDVPIRAVI